MLQIWIYKRLQSCQNSDLFISLLNLFVNGVLHCTVCILNVSICIFHLADVSFFSMYLVLLVLECFDTVGWAAGRASGL